MRSGACVQDSNPCPYLEQSPSTQVPTVSPTTTPTVAPTTARPPKALNLILGNEVFRIPPPHSILISNAFNSGTGTDLGFEFHHLIILCAKLLIY